MVSSSIVLSPLVLSVKFRTPSPAPPRVRLHPSLATATTAARTSTEDRRSTSASTCLRPHRRMASYASLYDILGIQAGATGQEIKTAYRRLARICHPDVATYDRKDTSSDEFIEIHAAYCTLSDPEKRAVYDQKLFRSKIPLTTVSRFSGYSGRSWETDQCW